MGMGIFVCQANLNGSYCGIGVVFQRNVIGVDGMSYTSLDICSQQRVYILELLDVVRGIFWYMMLNENRRIGIWCHSLISARLKFRNRISCGFKSIPKAHGRLEHFKAEMFSVFYFFYTAMPLFISDTHHITTKRIFHCEVYGMM